MGTFQEAARVPALFADDANSSCTAEPNKVVERKSYLGKFDILDRHLHWAKSTLQPVSYSVAGNTSGTSMYITFWE